METKEIILEASLELFSQKGFNASSVRDIAEKTGIKDSSLYYHYKNKQAILDALSDKFIRTSKQMMALVESAVSGMTALRDEDFYAMTAQYLERYFLDAFMRRFIMIMNHERSHNAQLREQYICWCIQKPIAFQTTVMQKLQDLGYLKQLDAQYQAMQYYAPIFLFFNQYMTYDDAASNKEAFKKAAMTATADFLKLYRQERQEEESI